jgi:hypothetical protein
MWRCWVLLEDLQDLDARQRGLQPAALEFFGVGTRLQVRDILGTPLIADPFHADRWDYLFTIRRDGLPQPAPQRGGVVRGRPP